MQPQSKHPRATSGQYSFSGFLVFKCPRPTSQCLDTRMGSLQSMPRGHTEQRLAGCPHPPKQPCSRCNAVPLLYLVDGIMRDSVLVIFPLGGSFSTNTSGVGSSASWTSACWLDSCKHTDPSQEQTLPSLWLPRGLAGGTPGCYMQPVPSRHATQGQSQYGLAEREIHWRNVQIACFQQSNLSFVFFFFPPGPAWFLPI